MTVTHRIVGGALVAILAAGVAEHIGLYSMTAAFGLITVVLTICGFLSFLEKME